MLPCNVIMNLKSRNCPYTKYSLFCFKICLCYILIKCPDSEHVSFPFQKSIQDACLQNALWVKVMYSFFFFLNMLTVPKERCGMHSKICQFHYKLLFHSWEHYVLVRKHWFQLKSYLEVISSSYHWYQIHLYFHGKSLSYLIY